MKSIFLIWIITFALSFQSCSQTNRVSYEEKDYQFKSRGPDEDYPFVITFTNRSDTNWQLKKIYFDKDYKIIISQSFLYKGVPNGPFKTYASGKISTRGFYFEGKWDKERISYFDDSTIRQKAFFNKGVKTGIWMEYNKNGKIVRKTSYDNDGNIIEDVTF